MSNENGKKETWKKKITLISYVLIVIVLKMLKYQNLNQIENGVLDVDGVVSNV